MRNAIPAQLEAIGLICLCRFQGKFQSRKREILASDIEWSGAFLLPESAYIY